MSFLRPNLTYGFQELLQYFLWFQLFYAIWQFIRTAKFCQLPYVFVSSLWNGLDSSFKKRNIILLKNIPLDPVSGLSDPMPPGIRREQIDGQDHNYKVSFQDTIYVTDGLRSSHMVLLHGSFVRQPNVKFGINDDLLWPKGYLIRRVGFSQAMDHVVRGGGYESNAAIRCFFNYSSTEILNQNFLRFCSILPLVLQAKHFDFWSAVGSVIMIFLDVFSFLANKVWRSTQYWICRSVKKTISSCLARERRLFWYTFMSTISRGFNCSNFVTGEASVKLLQSCPMHSNIRLNKHIIRQVIPVKCVSCPWIRNNYFFIQGVWYRVLISNMYVTEPFQVTISLQPPDDCKTEGQTDHSFLQKEGWTREDMAYFYGVLMICDEAKVAPLTTLNGSDGTCCDLSALISAVKLRKIFVCEFVKNEKIYVS